MTKSFWPYFNAISIDFFCGNVFDQYLFCVVAKFVILRMLIQRL